MYIGRTQKCYRSQALAPSFRSVPILSSHEQYRRRCGRLVPKVRHSRFTTLSSSFCAALISNALDMFDILSLHFFEMSIFVLVTNHVNFIIALGILDLFTFSRCAYLCRLVTMHQGCTFQASQEKFSVAN